MELKSLDYVVLIVDDIDKAQRFYTETLGLPLKHRSGDYAQIALSGTRLGLFSRAAMAAVLGHALVPGAPSAKFELGFKVDDCDAAFDELVACGVPAITAPQTRSWGQRTAYVADPDGNLIELVED
jgi:lactoylglutathione lyase